MTKLRRIRRSLESNKDLVVMEDTTRTTIEKQDVSFFVAPKKPIYQAEALQEFMLGLIKDPEHEGIFEVHEMDPWFHFGRLSYTERIGTRRTTEVVTVIDKDLWDRFEFTDDTLRTEKGRAYERCIEVYVCPSENLGRDIINGNVKDSARHIASLEDLRRYRGS